MNKLEPIIVHGMPQNPSQNPQDSNAKLVWLALSKSSLDSCKDALTSCDTLSLVDEYNMTPLMAAAFAGRLDLVSEIFKKFQNQPQALSCTNSLTFNFTHYAALNGKKFLETLVMKIVQANKSIILQQRTRLGLVPGLIADLVEGTYMAPPQQKLFLETDESRRKEEDPSGKQETVFPNQPKPLTQELFEQVTGGEKYMSGFKMEAPRILFVHLEHREDLKFLLLNRERDVFDGVSEGQQNDFFRKPPTLSLRIDNHGKKSLIAQEAIKAGSIICITGGKVEPFKGKMIKVDDMNCRSLKDMTRDGIPNAVLKFPALEEEGAFLVAQENIEKEEGIRIAHEPTSKYKQTYLGIVDETFLGTALQKIRPDDFSKSMGTEMLPYPSYHRIEYLVQTPIALAALFATGILTSQNQEDYLREVENVAKDNLLETKEQVFKPENHMAGLQEALEKSVFAIMLMCSSNTEQLIKNHKDLSAFLKYLEMQSPLLKSKYLNALTEWTMNYTQETLFACLELIPSMLDECEEKKLDSLNYVEMILTFYENIGFLYRGMFAGGERHKKNIEPAQPKEDELPTALLEREKTFLNHVVRSCYMSMKKKRKRIPENLKAAFTARAMKLHRLAQSLKQA